MVKMCKPRTISHNAMNMLRLLKKRSESVIGEIDVFGVLAGRRVRKAYVDASRYIAMTLATLRRAIVVAVVVYLLQSSQ